MIKYAIHTMLDNTDAPIEVVVDDRTDFGLSQPKVMNKQIRCLARFFTLFSSRVHDTTTSRLR